MKDQGLQNRNTSEGAPKASIFSRIWRTLQSLWNSFIGLFNRKKAVEKPRTDLASQPETSKEVIKDRGAEQIPDSVLEQEVDNAKVRLVTEREVQVANLEVAPIPEIPKVETEAIRPPLPLRVKSEYQIEADKRERIEGYKKRGAAKRVKWDELKTEALSRVQYAERLLQNSVFTGYPRENIICHIDFLNEYCKKNGFPEAHFFQDVELQLSVLNEQITELENAIRKVQEARRKAQNQQSEDLQKSITVVKSTLNSTPKAPTKMEESAAPPATFPTAVLAPEISQNAKTLQMIMDDKVKDLSFEQVKACANELTTSANQLLKREAADIAVSHQNYMSSHIPLLEADKSKSLISNLAKLNVLMQEVIALIPLKRQMKAHAESSVKAGRALLTANNTTSLSDAIANVQNELEKYHLMDKHGLSILESYIMALDTELEKVKPKHLNKKL